MWNRDRKSITWNTMWSKCLAIINMAKKSMRSRLKNQKARLALVDLNGMADTLTHNETHTIWKTNKPNKDILIIIRLIIITTTTLCSREGKTVDCAREYRQTHSVETGAFVVAHHNNIRPSCRAIETVQIKWWCWDESVRFHRAQQSKICESKVNKIENTQQNETESIFCTCAGVQCQLWICVQFIAHCFDSLLLFESKCST